MIEPREQPRRAPAGPPADYFHLRTQWLQYRSQLFDHGTGLPTLPAIFDDIRRAVEEKGAVFIIYVDLGRENSVEETWGWQVYDSILKDFVDTIKRVKSSILPPQAVLSLVNVRGDEFLLFITPPERREQQTAFRSEMEQLTQEFAGALDEELARMPTTTGVRQLHLATGRSFVMADPMQRLERQLYKAIGEARQQLDRKIERDEVRLRAVLKKIISERSVRTVYQPIVYLEDGRILGYEALTRGPENSHFKNSESLFRFADRTDLGVELDRVCRETAVMTASTQASQRLFLNTSALAITRPDFIDDHFITLIKDKGIPNKNIVFEITERVKIEEWETFKQIITQLRQHRFAIAIDDMGAGYSSLQSIAEIEPEFLKFDMSLVHNIHNSLIKQDLCKVLLTLSEKLGAPIIAEGVETNEEYSLLRSFGVKLGQGNFFLPPGQMGRPLNKFL
ncbi:MAG: EAL domain-containing protein [Acidobacteriota bacterium]